MEKGKSGVFCLSVLAFLLALVAFILTVIIWADPKLVPNIKDQYYESDAETKAEPAKEPAPEPSGKLDFGDSGKMGREDRIYIFGAFGAMPPFSFIDDMGVHRGYGVETVLRLCRVAGKKCRFIALKTYQTMWDGSMHVSEGLLRRFFDAGVYILTTPERAAGYAFTEALFKGDPGGDILIKTGATFVENELTTKKIGFVAGYYTSVECLEREIGKTIPPDNVVTLGSVNQVAVAMQGGTIELAFLPGNEYEGEEMVVGRKIEGACSAGDISMIVRKDSPLLGWMNDVTKQMKENGQYKELCDELSEKYNTTVACVM